MVALGKHSGKLIWKCAVPPLGPKGKDGAAYSSAVVAEIREATHALARRLQVQGLMNIQYAVKYEEGRFNVYVLEVNPRASRTVPFVSKATGVPLAKAAAKVMVDVSLAEQGYREEPIPTHVSVKEAVFPFPKFAGVDIVLGPEMKSTGEVIGTGESFGEAYAKAQASAGTALPTSGRVFVSVHDQDKPTVLPIVRELVDLVRGITGWETSLWELMKIGERAINLARVFNAREGFTREDDSLPDRFFEPLEGEGPLAGYSLDRKAFREALDLYYGMMGWDTKMACPTRAKLMELDVGWAADHLP